MYSKWQVTKGQVSCLALLFNKHALILLRYLKSGTELELNLYQGAWFLRIGLPYNCIGNLLFYIFFFLVIIVR